MTVADAAVQSTRSTREAFDAFLRWTIEREWPVHAEFLPDGEREAFADYYKSLPPATDMAGVARFLRGFWRSEAGWAARWIAERSRSLRSSGACDGRRLGLRHLRDAVCVRRG